MWPVSIFFEGRSETFVRRPNTLNPSGSLGSPTTSPPFQNPNDACSLKADMPHSIPLYMNVGLLHFSVSSHSGHAACTVSRMWVRIGLAKSADFAMYASTRG